MPLPPHVRAMADVRDEAYWARIRSVENSPIRTARSPPTAFAPEQVRAAIPPERLLVFDVADGWEPLCRFLGHKIPNTPFPNTNSNEDFWKLVSGEPH